MKLAPTYLTHLEYIHNFINIFKKRETRGTSFRVISQMISSDCLGLASKTQHTRIVGYIAHTHTQHRLITDRVKSTNMRHSVGLTH